MIPDLRPLLIVSLPRNDVTLAVAAKESGAHVLKVHVNVRHLASGTVFGSLPEERPQLEKILALGLPTGLVPGEEQMIAPEEISVIRRMSEISSGAIICSSPGTRPVGRPSARILSNCGRSSVSEPKTVPEAR